MKKLLLPLLVAAALAVPASALAWGGGHDHHGAFGFGFGAATKLSGTGTSFGGTSATVTGSNLDGTLSTTWSSATSKTFLYATFSCAPATASLTVASTTTSYTGRTCSFARNSTTRYVFIGKASDGSRALLGEDGATVRGAVLEASAGLHLGMFADLRSGNCDHH